MFDKISLIVSREYLTRVRKKSFIIISILAPIGLVCLMLIPSLITLIGQQSLSRIAVIDETNHYAKYLNNTDIVEFVIHDNDTTQNLKQNFAKLNYQAYLHITGTPENRHNITLYSENTPSISLQQKINNDLSDALRTDYLNNYKGNKNEVDSLLNRINNARANLTSISIAQDGTEQNNSGSVAMVLSFVTALIIYMVVLLYGNMVMTGVIEEKRNRIVEVLISSVKPFELMMGKIIGIGLVALTQFAIWIVFGSLLFIIVGLFIPVSDISASTNNFNTDVLIQEILATNLPSLLTYFFLYFLFGYLLYASFFAWIGATMDNPSDGQQITLLLTLPLCIALYIALYAMQDPESNVIWWASFIPFTSPIVMLARIPFGVPTYEIIISLTILVATFIASTWLGGKIYRLTILMYGNNVTLKQIFKYLKLK